VLVYIDVSKWTIEDVVAWAREKIPGKETLAEVLERQEVNGTALLQLTYDKLVREPFKLTGGVAQQLETLAKQLSPPITVSPAQSLGVDGLFDFILQSPSLCVHFKKDFTKPHPLSTNPAGFKRLGRTDAFKSAYAAMAQRRQLRAKNLGNPADRLFNPLPATLATTGGGKSFFLTEIGELRPKDLLLCEDEEMREILQNSVAVSITFNSGFDVIPEVDGIHKSSLGIALRVLHSYFIDHTRLAFDTFVDLMKPLFDQLSLPLAIHCVTKHSRKGVLLLVDEVTKSACGDNTVCNTILQIGNCLNTFSATQFNTVVTTLDPTAFIFIVILSITPD
jgi:hypothetical protein